MQKVKQKSLPPSGVHWSYGAGFMREISESEAVKLCARCQNPALPKMGFEKTISTAELEFSRVELCVQNISGSYFLASCQVPVKSWPHVFGFEILEN